MRCRKRLLACISAKHTDTRWFLVYGNRYGVAGVNGSARVLCLLLAKRITGGRSFVGMSLMGLEAEMNPFFINPANSVAARQTNHCPFV